MHQNSKVLYAGIPKNLQSQDAAKHSKDRIGLSNQKWLSKHGNHLLQLDKTTADEARKLFYFINIEKQTVVTKQQIKQMIEYFESQFEEVDTRHNTVVRRLKKMVEMPTVKEFTEEAFAYFFCELKKLEKVVLHNTESSSTTNTGQHSQAEVAADQKQKFEAAQTKYQDLVSLVTSLRTQM